MSAFELIRRIERLEARVKELEAARAVIVTFPQPELSREDLAEKYRQKFGKRPHHFMKTEKIKEALNGG